MNYAREQYARDEFMETARRVFAPGRACAASVKGAENRCAKILGVSAHRARDLMRGKALPRVEEMDVIRSLDGRWCNKLRQMKASMSEQVHEIWEFVQTIKPRMRAKREARKSSIVERVMDRA